MNQDISDDFIVISRDNSPSKDQAHYQDDTFIDATPEIEKPQQKLILLPPKHQPSFKLKESDASELTDPLSRLSIRSNTKTSSDTSKINPADYLHHKYSSKVIKDKKCRQTLLKKHKTYMKDLSAFTQKSYYNEKADSETRDLYYANVPDIKDATFEELHQLIFHTKRTYKRGKELFALIDRRPDGTLRDIYTDNIIEDEKGVPQIEFYNEEHSFPQCYQAGTNSGAGKDLHQIFASDKDVNYARGKKPMGMVPDSVFVKESKCGIVYKSGKVKSFIPHCNKGAIARSFLYVLVCYGNICDHRKFPIEYLHYIIDTAVTEPVTLWEKHRNAEIHARQGNRNPFIDYPEIARKIDFAKNGFR